MAMAELRDWQQDDDGAAQAHERVRHAEERARRAEEQRVQAEGRCFGAERRRLDAERRLEQVEELLQEARLAGERTRKLVLELITVAAQLRAELERSQTQASPACPDEAAAAERAEMADALAAAVERLRARVAEVKEIEHEPVSADRSAAGPFQAAASSVPAAAQAASEAREPHKHSMSAIARWRNKRKQRQQG
jgi:polyhydroxyalkanoate synthesis regulator phasin